MVQTANLKVLDNGKDVHRLTTRQIKSICSNHGWVCQMEHIESAKITNVDRRIVKSPRYRKSNAVMVARSTGGTSWLRLGWRWDVETLNESQIVELLKALEPSHNNELSGSCSNTGSQA